ncbi:MAG TPA: hypothetical protein VFO64_01160 [Gaiellaceae bacterium]|jgi:uncharacterized protein with PQ loop repeat|nr:hypothetical protein [Gaiellaceae bacterium]
MIGHIAMIYGMASALAVLLQARVLLQRGRSCDVSALLFGIYLGGYLLWLGYGIELGSVPIVMSNVVGLLSTAIVLAIALTLRGSLWTPRSWRSCPV